LHQILGTQVDAFLIWWDQLANRSYLLASNLNSMQRLEQQVILAIHPHTIITMSKPHKLGVMMLPLATLPNKIPGQLGCSDGGKQETCGSGFRGRSH